MKIFLDTADTSSIQKHFATGLIDGITTNPTLIRKSGRYPLEVYQELKDLGLQDISMEVVGDADEMIKAKSEGILLSLHVKTTMMRISDPIIFGHCVSVYFEDVLKKYAKTFNELGVNPDNGIAELYTRIQALPENQRKEIEADMNFRNS